MRPRASVDLRWPAAIANTTGAALQGYLVYRDGIYLGSPRQPNFQDLTVTPGETTVYSIQAVDQHGNLSTPATVSVTVPQGLGAAIRPAAESHLGRLQPRSVPSGPTVDQREIGVRPNGSYYGAAGENIDLLSGNLNFSIPVFKALSRDNWGVTFALSYNSQMWRKDSNGNVWLLGKDIGLGLGWTLQAGSVVPVILNGVTQYYIYSDASGAQYLLDQNNGSNVWTSSSDGVYIFFDANADVLHFTDGSFWKMGSQSASSEPDAGTLYPSQM